MWLKVIVSTIVVLIFVITAAILYGVNRWHSNMNMLNDKQLTA